MPLQYQVTDAFSMVHPITLVRGKNAEIWDCDEQRYIDFVGGIGVLNFGHCHPHNVAAITEQSAKLIHYAYNAAGHLPYQTLMPRLCDLIPINDKLAGMLTNSGAEATENALKVARLKSGRHGVIAFDGGFHGRTLGAVALNGKVKPYKSGLGTMSAEVFHIPFPSPSNDISPSQAQAALERLITVEVDLANIGAIIFEPVQGEGGFQLMTPEFAQYLRKFYDDHDIILIADEIQSGFGRTGVPFAFTHLGIEPDLLLLGKSIAGGLPLGAVIGRSHLMNDLPLGSLGGTYSGNPVACSAARAVLDIMTAQQGDESVLLNDGKTVWQQAHHYQTTLEATFLRWQQDHLSPWLCQLTGIGAMRGIELRHPEFGTHPKIMALILKYARSQGLLLMPSGQHRHIIRLLPPLTIEAKILQEGLQILADVLATLPTSKAELAAL